MAVSHPLLFDASMLLCAGASVYTAIQGVRSGEIFIAIGVHAKRAEDPLMFWFGIVLWVVGAIAFVWAMFLAQQ